MDDFRLKYGKTNEELREQLRKERIERGKLVMAAIAGRPVEPGQAIYRNEIVSVDPSAGIIKGTRKQRRALGRKNNG